MIVLIGTCALQSTASSRSKNVVDVSLLWLNTATTFVPTLSERMFTVVTRFQYTYLWRYILSSSTTVKLFTGIRVLWIDIVDQQFVVDPHARSIVAPARTRQIHPQNSPNELLFVFLFETRSAKHVRHAQRHGLRLRPLIQRQRERLPVPIVRNSKNSIALKTNDTQRKATTTTHH